MLALAIAGMGLFGLAILTTQRREREIGVRKVLGASSVLIAASLTTDFLKLVGVALLIAIPISYVAVGRWLDNFAYRIEVGPGIFLAAGAIATVIVIIAVGGRSLKAAMLDPVTTLRAE